MASIDQALFNFSPRIGLAVAVMVGFLVFAVALDLTWDQFRRVLKKPKAPGIGLLAQYLILPGVAFGIGLLMAATPSIALGLLLVACCPAGALSNYLTGVARGSVATSVSMTAVSTLFSVVVTLLLLAFWASMNPETRAVLQRIEIDPKRVATVLLIMLIVPVAAGMIIRAKRPDTADKIRAVEPPHRRHRIQRRGGDPAFGQHQCPRQLRHGDELIALRLPPQRQPLAGREHGRTIPLAGIKDQRAADLARLVAKEPND